MQIQSKLLLLIAGSCSLAFLTFAQQSPGLSSQTNADADRKSSGCVRAGCHVNAEPMHTSEAVRLGCTDCHGGNAETTDKALAHISPSNRELFRTSAVPVRVYADWLKERAEYIRFINPGDFRVVDQTCGTSGCHEDISLK